MITIKNFVQKPVYGDVFIYDFKKQWVLGALEIESENIEKFWGKRNFYEQLSKNFVKGYVVVKLNTLIGFIVYACGSKNLQILNLGIHSKFQKQGLGTLLVDRVKKRLNNKYLTCNVRESNLNAQLFLKKKKFIATKVLKNYYCDEYAQETENAYKFKYQIKHI